MKREIILEELERLTDLPDTIPKIRDIVLSLAFQGKLVPQDQHDDSALTILKRAADQRNELVRARRIKKRSISPVASDERPFELPAHWQWARLSQVGHELGQQSPSEAFTYIDVGSIDSHKGMIGECLTRLNAASAPSRARKLVKPGTIIYSMVRPYLLNAAIVDRAFDPKPIASTAFAVLFPFSDFAGRYLLYWLRSPAFTEYVRTQMKGMAYPAINDAKFYNGPVPIPPVNEQKQIIAKADKLMDLCDQLEAQQEERKTRHAALARASLTRFTEAPTPANLEFLFHPSYSITPADLRKVVLTLAVQGKLVHRDVKGKPAKQLLGEIASHRKKLVDSGAIRKSKLQRRINLDEAPYKIPQTWVWTSLGSVTDIGTGSTPPKTESIFWENGTVPWITSGATNQAIITTASAHITPMAVDTCRMRIYPPDTLLVALYGQGKTRGQVAVLGIPATINQACAAVCPLPGLPSMQRYLRVLLERQYDEMRSLAAGGAQPNLNVRKIKELLVPLPPLAEQVRIVAKVEQLMALIDELELQLTASRATAKSLLSAVVAELTASPA